MKLHFLGGVDTVTGSQHLLEAQGRVLRDCGMFQGKRKLAREINSSIPVDPSQLDGVVLSHAHIDHCGNLPSLARMGYKGPVYLTSATADLCEIMLRDSAHIQEQDAEYLNQKTNRRGFKPVEPLYTLADAEQVLAQFSEVNYGQEKEVAPGMYFTSYEAGHILGAALTSFRIEEEAKTTNIGFAVDLGRKNLPLIRDPQNMPGLDVLVLESTYGDRHHDDALHAEEKLGAIVNKTYKRGGKILIPSFALERSQEILYHLSSLIHKEEIPKIPVYVDSPMASAVTHVFRENRQYLDKEYQELKNKMGSVMHAPWVHFVSSVAESKELVASDKPCIVISASGMCEHGRILHHLKHGVENPNNTIVIVGFQAAYTLGRRIVERQKEVRIFGDMFPLNADVEILNAFSAHADQEDLVRYVEETRPGKVFLVHGEQHEREALAELLRKKLQVDVQLPVRGDVVDI